MTAVVKRLGPINEVVKDFFLVFARFEYALKATGFVTGDEGNAHADWGGFARSIAKSFDKNKDGDLRESCFYILAHVPRKQVFTDGHLSWKYAPPDIHMPEVGRILLTISRIRENLLHGGTFAHGHYAEVGEDDRLLQSSLLVLNRCLELDNELEGHFNR